MNEIKIGFDEDDYTVIVELNRIGSCDYPALSLVTGDFSGQLPSRLNNLVYKQSIAAHVHKETGDLLFSATSSGVVSAYLYDSFKRGCRKLYRFNLLKLSGIKLKQKYCLKSSDALHE